jgi:hypothetical protein
MLNHELAYLPSCCFTPRGLKRVLCGTLIAWLAPLMANVSVLFQTTQMAVGVAVVASVPWSDRSDNESSRIKQRKAWSVRFVDLRIPLAATCIEGLNRIAHVYTSA